jgi:hypothetical protein
MLTLYEGPRNVYGKTWRISNICCGLGCTNECSDFNVRIVIIFPLDQQVVAGFLHKTHVVCEVLLNKQIFIWRDCGNTYFHLHLNLKLQTQDICEQLKIFYMSILYISNHITIREKQTS